MSKKQPFGESEILEIGKSYYIRCAKMVFEDKYYFVPVIGEPHTDKDFGNAVGKHLHIDGRFTDDDLMERLNISENGVTSTVCSFPPANSIFSVGAIVVKKLTCKRLTTGMRTAPLVAHRYWRWYDTMIGKSCKGKRCPHYGTMMHVKDGKLICPLHNLKGDIEKEIIIPYE